MTSPIEVHCLTIKDSFFKVAKSSSAYPVERIQGKWEICSPETAEDFSVVAFALGKVE